MMRIAILGAGAIGLGTASLLCQAGHQPILWSPTGRSTAALQAGDNLLATGMVEGRFTPGVATDCAAALDQADVVLIAAPGNAHRVVLDAAIPHLRDGQTVLFSSHMSFAALYLQNGCARRNVHPVIVAWGTTVLTARRTSAHEVWVGNIRSQVDLAVLPGGDAAAGLALCTRLFGDRFRDRGSLLAIALSNLNPQNHLAIALCNLTRMERGEAWKQYLNTTPAVGRLMEALDAERMDVARACGVTVRSLHEHFRLSFAAEGETMGEMARHLAGGAGDPNGPATLESRYVLEDVPFGLWPTVCLARAAKLDMTLHESGVAIFSALYGRDFRAENDILPALGDLGALLGR